MMDLTNLLSSFEKRLCMQRYSLPVISGIDKNATIVLPINLQPSKIEDAYRCINASLKNLISELYMKL